MPSRPFKCHLCGKGGRNPKTKWYFQTYFCSSHSGLIQEFITAKGDYGANLWLSRRYNISQLALELQNFALDNPHKFHTSGDNCYTLKRRTP